MAAGCWLDCFAGAAAALDAAAALGNFGEGEDDDGFGVGDVLADGEGEPCRLPDDDPAWGIIMRPVSREEV